MSNLQSFPPHPEDDNDIVGGSTDDELCPECHGSGENDDDNSTCFGCGGWGYLPDPDADDKRRRQERTTP